MSTRPLYTPVLLDHYHNPRHCGLLEGHNRASGVMHPSCGDKVALQGFVRDGILEKLMFQGSGCVISQASASLLVEHVIGMPVEAILALRSTDVVKLLGIELGPTRQLCATLILDALHKALAIAGEEHA